MMMPRVEHTVSPSRRCRLGECSGTPEAADYSIGLCLAVDHILPGHYGYPGLMFLMMVRRLLLAAVAAAAACSSLICASVGGLVAGSGDFIYGAEELFYFAPRMRLEWQDDVQQTLIGWEITLS